jgi:hypothetical protein
VIRGARAALLALAIAVAGAAFAQDGRVAFVTSGLVSFTVTPEAFAAAGACPACEPIAPDPGTAIVLEVTRQNPNRLYTIDVLHDGWGPPGDLPLEARYTVTSTNGQTVFLTTAWLPIDAAPTLVFTQAVVQRENRVRVEVDYRMALRGDEPAGTFATRVTHRVRENGVSVAHDVRVSIPSFLSLRLVGRTPGVASAVVAFDYADAPGVYLQAVTSGTPLAPTGHDLVRVEVATNHPSGYAVTARVEELLAPAGAPSFDGRLWLAGAPAQGRTFVGAGPTDGFVTIATGDDYGLRVDGGEAPGAYLFSVTFEAVRNP